MYIGRIMSNHPGGYHEDDEYEIAAVGWRTPCHNCGGWGLMSRECPSETKSYDSKGHGKGDGKGGKSDGKGKNGFVGQGRRQGQELRERLPGRLLQLRAGRTQGMGVPPGSAGRGGR